MLPGQAEDPRSVAPCMCGRLCTAHRSVSDEEGGSGRLAKGGYDGGRKCGGRREIHSFNLAI